jgi:membrane associated rhomboid family serine protease
MLGLIPFRELPYVLRVFLILNAVVFGLSLLRVPVIDVLVFRIDSFFSGEVWRLFTYMFSHEKPLHFLFNMLMLWMFGGEVAQAMGQRRFASFYLACGALAMLLSMWFHPFTLGASGALYAVMFAYAWIYPERTILMFLVFPMKMKWAIYAFAALDFLMFSSSQGGGVAHLTHLGGFLAAFLWLKFFDSSELWGVYRQKTPWGRWFEGREVFGTSAKPVMPPGVPQKPVVVDFRPMAGEQSANGSVDSSNEGDVMDDQERLDAVLAKVSKSGMGSLSEEEKDFLLEASRLRQIRSGRTKE